MTMALVLRVINFFILFGSMFPVSDLQSAMTGVAFVEKIGVAVA